MKSANTPNPDVKGCYPFYTLNSYCFLISFHIHCSKTDGLIKSSDKWEVIFRTGAVRIAKSASQPLPTRNADIARSFVCSGQLISIAHLHIDCGKDNKSLRLKINLPERVVFQILSANPAFLSQNNPFG
jgi:hypothetical protein